MNKDSRPNILFIMCDQLRWDYLSCYGHPTLKTPNIDRLATSGLRFTQAYCQAPLCGPSRASFYTGRYLSSHGAMVNDDPLRAGELTLGDYLEELGYRTALVGKTHTSVSKVGQARLDVSADSSLARRLACGGFEPYEVHEGLYPDPIMPAGLGYNNYLNANGYEGSNPWQTYANNGAGDRDEVKNGWLLRNCKYPTRIAEQHSETAFVTNRAMDFIGEANGNEPWCLHLSYIKPHWPLMAPDPYHSMYSAADIVAPVRNEQEKSNRHPVVQAFAEQEYSVNYANDHVRDIAAPVYMGLIKQIDDHLGRVFAQLESLGIWHNTLIVFTSDHGDYLGDHWLGEKDLFHDCSSRIPLIIHDPRPSADSTRGKVEEALVESIDLIPTFVESAGGTPCIERLEGYSLMPYLNGNKPIEDSMLFSNREFVVSEIDYSDRGARKLLGVAPYLCRAYMLRSKQWKYNFYEGFQPELFDLENDPDELNDLGESSQHQDRIGRMNDQLFTWLRQRKLRTELPYEKLDAMGPELDEKLGIVIGRW